MLGTRSRAPSGSPWVPPAPLSHSLWTLPLNNQERWLQRCLLGLPSGHSFFTHPSWAPSQPAIPHLQPGSQGRSMLLGLSSRLSACSLDSHGPPWAGGFPVASPHRLCLPLWTDAVTHRPMPPPRAPEARVSACITSGLSSPTLLRAVVTAASCSAEKAEKQAEASAWTAGIRGTKEGDSAPSEFLKTLSTPAAETSTQRSAPRTGTV